MGISGNIFIDGNWVIGQGGKFQASNPLTNEQSNEIFSHANSEQLNIAVNSAAQAFAVYSQYSDSDKAIFLRTIAQQLEGCRQQIVERATWETALPEMRINGELGRTIGQLGMFAKLLDKGDWKRAVIDVAQPERQPLAKPDLRLTQVPLGPVAVFSASNFPLAFSVAGGDTASALAAGCPVIVKTHSAHPGTSELVAKAIVLAIDMCGLPKGVFAMIHGSGHTIGAELVKHPHIKAVGFTGSIAGGRALFDIAVSRPEPIPFFGELGSTNPVFLLPQSLERNAEHIAQSFLSSMMMGVGQFCTSPGILIAIKGAALDSLLINLAQRTPELAAETMLTAGINTSFNKICAEREANAILTTIAKGIKADGAANQARVALFSVEASDYLNHLSLEEEVFGPSALVIACNDQTQLLEIANSMRGHLTAAVFATEQDQQLAKQLLPILQKRVGRILFDSYGTGVELSSAMSHGGPYPSSSAGQTTSVGTRAIERFIRPLCYQNTPDALLPEELKNSNPRGIMRLVNDVWSDRALG